MRNLKFIIIGLIVFLLLGVIAWAASGFQVFWNGEKMPARTVIKDGVLYMAVEDLAGRFPGEITIDMKKRQVKFDQPGGGDLSPVIKQKIAQVMEKKNQALVWGTASYEKDGIILPVRRMDVYLHPGRSDLPEKLKNDRFTKTFRPEFEGYYEMMGVIRKCETDYSGRYILYPVPAGEYEVTARYRNYGGRWAWRKHFKLEAGEVYRFDMDETSALKYERI